MACQFTKSQVNDAVQTRNGPDTTDIQNAPLNSHVLIYHPEKNRSDDPFCLLNIESEHCIVLLPPPSGPTKFRTTVFKHFIPEKSEVASENNLLHPQ